MKKFLSLFVIAALLLPVLAGCQSAEQSAQAPQSTPVIAGTSENPVQTPLAPKLSRDEALSIALEDAGLKQEDILDLEIELDREGNSSHYDVDFEKDDRDYDYEIDAETGEILRKDIPTVPAPTEQAPAKETSASTQPKTESDRISRNKARDIALKHAGFKTSQVRDLEVELDKDDGTVHYDVDFEADGYDYEYEIHAESGKILKSHKERD